ncbi:MAG: Flp pilus assembly protein CpaB [Bdellovibrionaceae bacterium]|jgi:pilus assembly protein CpaB|nr:Flp pilus assembly protein CpaB [Pseudobdellovibrionaceae bacterium]
MNNNESKTLWLSIGFALFGAFMIYSYTQEQRAKVTKDFGTQSRVVVATQDINEMQTIDETMIQIVEQPTKYIQPSAINNPELAVGKVALAPIKKEEQILESKILTPGPVTGLSLQVSPSKRAVTIPVDDMRGVAKLIKPGDRIDLIAALDVGKGQAKRKEVKTMLQDVIILATGLVITNELPRLYEKIGKDNYIKSMRGDTSFNTITIEVSPKEAQELIYILATAPSSLFVTLRNPNDHTKKRLNISTENSVLKKVAPSLLRKQVRRPTSLPKPKPQLKKKQKKKYKRGAFNDL